MNCKDKIGILGEIKAASFLIEEGFDVFIPFSGKTSFDLAAHKDNKLYRVEVKTTRTKSPGGWTVRIKKSRHNKTENFEIPFDSNSCDLLAVYVEPEDRVILVDPNDINNTTYFTVY